MSRGRPCPGRPRAVASALTRNPSSGDWLASQGFPRQNLTREMLKEKQTCSLIDEHLARRLIDLRLLSVEFRNQLRAPSLHAATAWKIETVFSAISTLDISWVGAGMGVSTQKRTATNSSSGWRVTTCQGFGGLESFELQEPFMEMGASLPYRIQAYLARDQRAVEGLLVFGHGR